MSGSASSRSRRDDRWHDLLDKFFRRISSSNRAYKTRHAYRKDCTEFVEFVISDSQIDPHGLSAAHVQGWLDSRSDLAPATIRRKLSSVRQFCGFLRDSGVLSDDPTADVEVPAGAASPCVPGIVQCLRLLAACSGTTELTILSMPLLAGLTRGELLCIDLDDLADDYSRLRVRTSSGAEREVPACGFLQKVLAAHIAERDAGEGALLLNDAGNPMESTTFHRLFRRVVERAGLDGAGITPSSLREAFANMLVDLGADVMTVADLLGVGVETAVAYFGPSSMNPREIVDRLEEHLNRAVERQSTSTDDPHRDRHP